MRRDVLGGKRGAGHAYQDRGERVRRPDPTKVTTAGTTERLTSAAGLVAFGQFLRQQGIDRELHSSFDGLKTGHGVVYSMANQMRLMLDAHVAGESRAFGIEALASDPVFVRLAVPVHGFRMRLGAGLPRSEASIVSRRKERT